MSNTDERAREVCIRCGLLIENDEAAMYVMQEQSPQHVMCPPPTETDRNGVHFGWNCMTRTTCKVQNLCLGTCKLY